jgi:5-methylcytosine-specific restriction endonuclease McrA
LEVWFDRFSGYPERKLYAGFSSQVRPQIVSITKHVSRKLWPTRVVNREDTTQEKYWFLKKRLGRFEFNIPILEKYYRGKTFFGIYDPTRATSKEANSYFCARAVAFFDDVARALPHARPEDEQRDVYPRYENRKRVASHLRRERSSLLATECKIRDKYQCRVCGFHFEDDYGRLGLAFAEAHHLVPLGQLQEQVKTHLEDLATLCANCHRMVHRMTGKGDDIKKLISLVRKQQGKRI